MALKYKLSTNRSFLNVTSSEYFNITTTCFVYIRVNWNKLNFTSTHTYRFPNVFWLHNFHFTIVLPYLFMRATCSVHMPLRFIIFSVHGPRTKKSGITAITFCSKLFFILCCILYVWNSLPNFEVLTSYIKHVLKALRIFQCFPYKFHCFHYTPSCLSL